MGATAGGAAVDGCEEVFAEALGVVAPVTAGELRETVHAEHFAFFIFHFVETVGDEEEGVAGDEAVGFGAGGRAGWEIGRGPV